MSAPSFEFLDGAIRCPKLGWHGHSNKLKGVDFIFVSAKLLSYKVDKINAFILAS